MWNSSVAYCSNGSFLDNNVALSAVSRAAISVHAKRLRSLWVTFNQQPFPHTHKQTLYYFNRDHQMYPQHAKLNVCVNMTWWVFTCCCDVSSSLNFFFFSPFFFLNQFLLCNFYFLQKQLIAQTKMVLKVLFLYIPLPMFWALFDQQVK